MERFLIGVLEKNEAGAIHEGRIYNRWLTLRLSNQKRVCIFDMAAMSGDLHEGEVYRVIALESQPNNLRYFSDKSSVAKNPDEDWEGEIIATAWQAPQKDYQCVDETLYRGKWVLIATEVGLLLLTQEDFNGNINPGGLVRWNQSRLDLLAVI